MSITLAAFEFKYDDAPACPPSPDNRHRTFTMNLQLRSLAAALRPKTRPSDAAEAEPKPRPKTKPAPGWSQAWQTCRRKAAQLNLRPRRFSASTYPSSSSSKRTSRDVTPSSPSDAIPSPLSSLDSIAKPAPQVQSEERAPLEHVTSRPSTSTASGNDGGDDDDDETPTTGQVTSGRVVYRRPAAAACVEAQAATPGRAASPGGDGEPGQPAERGAALAPTPTAASLTSDYNASVGGDAASCYGSFGGDRRRVVEAYLEMQAESERSFVDRW